VQGAGERTVLCAHNLLTDREVYADVAARLAPRPRVVRVDARGHGESTARRAFSIVDLAHDHLAVLDEVGAARAVWAGVSLGAALALEAALRAPERVAGLALMGANPDTSTRRDALENTLLATIIRVAGWRRFVLATARDVLFGATFQAERPDELARWLARIASLERRAAWHAVRCWVKRPAVADRLGALRVPVRLIAGEEDVPAPPALSERVRAAVPGAELERVRAGHTVPLERPAEVAAAVERLLDATS
jgi:pimeloyl-ACP methyl ester carboxylesterase